MSFSSDVSKTLSDLGLGAGKVLEEVQALLSEFAALLESEKDDVRAKTVEKVFPQVFAEDAVVESSPDFGQLRQANWSTNCWLSPKVIVTPSTAQDVAKALAICRFVGATFSIRGGGHLQNPGFSSNDGGVVICMSKFTQLAVSDDRSTATIGMGLTWLDVYKALNDYGVTVTGGRVPTVGVAGLLLGGGLSFQNSEHGLSCMGVVNYQIVLADSTIVNANEKENPDLFWALRGGGPNFGIVTTVQMTTVPNQVWAEGRLYSPEMDNSLMEALIHYHEAIEKDNRGTLIWHAVEGAIVVIFFYCAPVENPGVFKCFQNIPFIHRLLEPGCRTVYDVVEAFAHMNAGPPKAHEMRTMSSLPDLEVYKAANECRLQQIEAVRHIEGALLTMVFQPMNSEVRKACDAKGGTPLGLKAQNHQWFLIMADWTHGKDEEEMREACRKVADTAETVAKKNGTYLPFVYSNYASRDQDPLASYGSENLRRLRDTAHKYDPKGIFQTLQNGGWLVSKAGLPASSV